MTESNQSISTVKGKYPYNKVTDRKHFGNLMIKIKTIYHLAIFLFKLSYFFIFKVFILLKLLAIDYFIIYKYIFKLINFIFIYIFL